MNKPTNNHDQNHHRCGPPGFIRRYWQRRKAQRLDKLAAELELSTDQRSALDEIINSLDKGRHLLLRQRRGLFNQLVEVLRQPDSEPSDQVFTELHEQYLQLAGKIAAFSRQLSEEQRQRVNALLQHGQRRCGGLTCRA